MPGLERIAERYTVERLYALQRQAWEINKRYALLKGEIFALAPVRMMFLPLNGEFRMEPIERMVDREVAHDLAILDDMCRTEIDSFIKRALGEEG